MTAEMTVQGDGNGGDIPRMAHNVIQLRQAQVRAAGDREYTSQRQEVQAYTAALDDFIARPEQAARTFLDFVFRAVGAVLPERKEEVARDYARRYTEGRDANPHVTHGKAGDAAALTGYLRRDPTFGPALRRIERRVEAALQESREGF